MTRIRRYQGSQIESPPNEIISAWGLDGNDEFVRAAGSEFVCLHYIGSFRTTLQLDLLWSRRDVQDRVRDWSVVAEPVDVKDDARVLVDRHDIIKLARHRNARRDRRHHRRGTV